MVTSKEYFAPGVYKFTVKSAKDAAALLRNKLGANARVLSVRSVGAAGLRRFLGTAYLEVIAEIDAQVSQGGLSEIFPNAAVSLVDSASRFRPSHPPAFDTELSGLLHQSGVAESALTRLQASAGCGELNLLPLRRALAETSRLIRKQPDARPINAPLSRAAFLGASGVGRTTALCKRLSVEVLQRGRTGNLVTVEFDRPNVPGPLTNFSEALGVPLSHFPCATRVASPAGFVFLDLPALSTRRPSDNATIAQWLDREQITERVLVLNAAYDRASLSEAYAAGRDVGATHLVFTHLDEVTRWGKLWDYLFDDAVEPLFLATGPSLTGDYEDDVTAAIARRTLTDC